MSPEPSPSAKNRRVLAVVPDLFFATRIGATALAAGVPPVEFVSPPHAATRAAAARADLVILDLHAKDAVAIITALKAAAPSTPIVGFHSHVDTELRRDALAAGADAVLPRSRFTVKLAELLEHGLFALGPGDAR